MDADSALDVLRREAGLLAVAAGTGLTRAVPRYPDWTVADLVVHTGKIHRWVTAIVDSGTATQIPQPEVTPDRAPSALVDWFMSGAADLALSLQRKDPGSTVWTFAGDQSVGFWRRRMALETTIHRWDAQAAAGRVQPIAPDIAAAGVSEALEVYLLRWLRGRAVGGRGQRVVLRATDSGGPWSLRLLPDTVAIDDDEDGDAPPADATISGGAEQLWRFLMGRCTLDELTVDGDAAVGDLCGRAIELMPAARR